MNRLSWIVGWGCGAVLAGCGAEAAMSGDGYDNGSPTSAGPRLQPEEGAEEEPREPRLVNPFVEVAHDPLSTFAADVDSASYEYFRSMVRDFDMLPERERVRTEEFINYFEYDYDAPSAEDEAPFAIHLDSAASVTHDKTQIVRVGIQGAVHEKPKTNLVYLVDVSGSMGESLPLVQRMLEETLDLLDPEDTLSIVTYAGSSDVVLPATPASDASTILAAIEGLESGGSTNGAGGIEAAYEQAESVFLKDGANHVLLCTDGDFNVGLSSDDELVGLIEEKRKSGVTLTVVGFGSMYNDGMLEKVTNAGNGIYGYVGSEDDAVRYARTRMLQTLVHIAKDVKIQVEFNPEFVYAYRLLGYEDRALEDDEFRDDIVDAGEIGSGHRVTALYEIVRRAEDMPEFDGAPELDTGASFTGEREVGSEAALLVKIRFKEPGASEADPAREVNVSLAADRLNDAPLDEDGDLAWAASVAAFTEYLRDSPYVKGWEPAAVRPILQAQIERDRARREFLQLFDAALELPAR